MAAANASRQRIEAPQSQSLTLLVAASVLAIGCKTTLATDTESPNAPQLGTTDHPGEDIESGGGAVPDFEAMTGEEVAGYFQAVMDGSEPQPDFGKMTDEEAGEYLGAMIVAAIGLAVAENGADDLSDQDAEHWGCGEPDSGCEYRDCPFRLTGSFDAGTGTVEIAGQLKVAEFKLAGLDRRWDWGWDEGKGYDYSIVMGPDGKARYFDFSRVTPNPVTGEITTTPTHRFQCVREPEANPDD